jgi:hypothetical protein
MLGASLDTPAQAKIVPVDGFGLFKMSLFGKKGAQRVAGEGASTPTARYIRDCRLANGIQ